MYIERLGNLVLSEVRGVPKKALEKFAGTPAAKKLARVVSEPLINGSERLFEYYGLDESIEASRQYLEKGYKLVVLASHKSHGDLPPGAHIMQAFMDSYPELLTDFALPIAASMGGGEQGNVIKTLHDEALVPSMKKRNIDTFPVVTDNDVTKRHMKPNSVRNGFSIIRRLKRRGTGFFVFIEGNMEGGRKDEKTGGVKGLQKADSMLRQILEYSKEKNFPLVFVMAGISKSHKTFSPTYKFVTPDWALATAKNVINPNNKFAPVNVSRPVPIDSMNMENIPQVIDNLMINLSSCLPEDERGIWKGADYLLKT